MFKLYHPVLLVLILLASSQLFALGILQNIERIAKGPNGAPRNNWIGQPKLSYDGRYLAFGGLATDLLPGLGGPNINSQWYLLDRQTGQIERVSVNSQGDPQFSDTRTDINNSMDISRDGRYVVFDSIASNLVPNDSNGLVDVFLFDRQTRQTTRVSSGLRESFSEGFAKTGEIVFRESRPNFASAAIVVDVGSSFQREITSPPGTLLYGVAKNFEAITYLDSISSNAALRYRSLKTGADVLVSKDSQGNPLPIASTLISADGKTVLFAPGSPTICCQLYAWHADSGQTQLVSQNNQGVASYGLVLLDVAMSDDGRYVVWDDVGNNLMGFPCTGADAFTHTLFMRDLVAQKSYHVALDRFGGLPSFFGMCEYLGSPSFGAYFRTTIYPNCPSISGDGKTLAFSSYSDRWSENDLAPPRSLNDPDNNPRRFLDVFVGTLGIN